LSGKWKILRAVVLLWGFLGCNHQDALHKETIMLQDRTIPPAANRIERSGLMRNNSGATASWNFEADRNWEAYTTWVQATFQATPLKTSHRSCGWSGDCPATFSNYR